MIYIVVPANALDSSAGSIAEGFPEFASTVRLAPYSELLRMKNVPSGAWIFTALSTLPNEQLSLLREFESVMQAHPPGIHVIGRPSLTQPRDAFFEAAERVGVRCARNCSIASLEDSFPDWAIVRWEHQGEWAESEVITDKRDLNEVLARLVFEGLNIEHMRGVTIPKAGPDIEPFGNYFRIGAESIMSDSLASFWKGKDGSTVPGKLSELLDRFGYEWARLDFVRTPRGPALWRLEDGPAVVPRLDAKALRIPGAVELRTWLSWALRALETPDAGECPIRIEPQRLRALLLGTRLR